MDACGCTWMYAVQVRNSYRLLGRVISSAPRRQGETNETCKKSSKLFSPTHTHAHTHILHARYHAHLACGNRNRLEQESAGLLTPIGGAPPPSLAVVLAAKLQGWRGVGQGGPMSKITHDRGGTEVICLPQCFGLW